MSASDYLKLPVQQSLNAIAVTRAQQEIAKQGKAFPCSVVSVDGAMVTVKFELQTGKLTLPNITIPKLESNWMRSPTQVGDLGITMSADVAISGIAGFGGTATLAQPGNLGALFFVPISSSTSPPPNQNQAIVQGPNGALIQSADGHTSINLTESEVVITVGGATYTFTASQMTSSEPVQVNSAITATGNIDSTGGDVSAGSVTLKTHTHQVIGVQTGGSTIVTTVGTG